MSFVERPDCPRAHSYQLFICNNPECILHIIAYDDEGRATCEIAVGREGAPHVIDACKAGLYRAVVLDEDNDSGL